MDVSNVDLNLLRVLNTVMEEKSVTRAAERLGRSQPTISNALNRARQLFGDELIIWQGSRMILTTRAEVIREPLRELVRAAEGCLAPQGRFKPEIAEGVCRIGLPERLSHHWIRRLYRRISRQAPKLSLFVTTTDREAAIRRLQDERIEVAIGVFTQAPPEFSLEPLFEEKLCLLGRADHPLFQAKGKIGIKRVLSFPHLVVSTTGSGLAYFDTLLSRRNQLRRVALAVSNFSAVPEILKDSDMIGVFGEMVCASLSSQYGLRTMPLPEIRASIPNSMIWHRRFDEDKRHMWLRRELAKLSVDMKQIGTR